jgi:K(+)-stimulated pyrophosphate-energized sodium pump
VLSAIAAFVYLPATYAELNSTNERRARRQPTLCRDRGRPHRHRPRRHHPVADRLLHRHRQARPTIDVARTSLTGPATVVLSGIGVGLESAVYTAVIIGAAVYGAFLSAPDRSPGALPRRARRLWPAHDGRRHRRDGHLRPGLGQRPGHRRDVGRRRRGGRADPHRARRRRQHDEGDHQGHRDRHGGPGGDGALRLLHRRLAAGAVRELDASKITQAEGRLPQRSSVWSPDRVATPSSASPRRGGRLPLLRPGDQRRDPRRRRDHLRGAPPVPRDPGIMEGTTKPEYGKVVDICTRDSLRELATPGLLAALTPIASASAWASARLPASSPAPSAPGAHGGLPGQLRWAVGQRQEDRRGRQLRWQGLRGARRHGHRRHRRRPLQGHRRPGHQPAHQGDEPRLGAHRPGHRHASGHR